MKKDDSFLTDLLYLKIVNKLHLQDAFRIGIQKTKSDENLMKISKISSPLQIFFGELGCYFKISYTFIDFAFEETLKTILSTV